MKRKDRNVELKKISLKTVRGRALRDKKFLNALFIDALIALIAVGWKLSAADMRKLLRIIDCTRVLKRMRNVYLLPMRVPWPPTWPTV